EQGRPVAEIAALELLPAIDALIWIAQDGVDVLGGRALRASRSTSLTKRARLAYEPYGVVGVIGAGSAPFAQPLGQTAAALLADAHLQHAAAGAVWAGCVGAGQARGSVERIYVAREAHDRFVSELVRAAQAVRVGNPADPSVQLGPLASERRIEHVGALVDDA